MVLGLAGAGMAVTNIKIHTTHSALPYDINQWNTKVKFGGGPTVLNDSTYLRGDVTGSQTFGYTLVPTADGSDSEVYGMMLKSYEVNSTALPAPYTGYHAAGVVSTTSLPTLGISSYTGSVGIGDCSSSAALYQGYAIDTVDKDLVMGKNPDRPKSIAKGVGLYTCASAGGGIAASFHHTQNGSPLNSVGGLAAGWNTNLNRAAHSEVYSVGPVVATDDGYVDGFIAGGFAITEYPAP
ncbi:hypothetical protein J7K55_00240 [Candidatus Aerophobetes bacterium]|nr:hypothetical protein [Candidatus Aerophobetes bacterium]